MEKQYLSDKSTHISQVQKETDPEKRKLLNDKFLTERSKKYKLIDDEIESYSKELLNRRQPLSKVSTYGREFVWNVNIISVILIMFFILIVPINELINGKYSSNLKSHMPISNSSFIGLCLIFTYISIIIRLINNTLIKIEKDSLSFIFIVKAILFIFVITIYLISSAKHIYENFSFNSNRNKTSSSVNSYNAIYSAVEDFSLSITNRLHISNGINKVNEFNGYGLYKKLFNNNMPSLILTSGGKDVIYPLGESYIFNDRLSFVLNKYSQQDKFTNDDIVLISFISRLIQESQPVIELIGYSLMITKESNQKQTSITDWLLNNFTTQKKIYWEKEVNEVQVNKYKVGFNSPSLIKEGKLVKIDFDSIYLKSLKREALNKINNLLNLRESKDNNDSFALYASYVNQFPLYDILILLFITKLILN